MKMLASIAVAMILATPAVAQLATYQPYDHMLLLNAIRAARRSQTGTLQPFSSISNAKDTLLSS